MSCPSFPSQARQRSASRLDGSTIHSWGEILWQKEGPGGSAAVGGAHCQKQDMSSMASKCELCRWVLIDEIEAVGAEILGELADNMTAAARQRSYKYRNNQQSPLFLRPFGGINVAFFGDFWQLPPVLQVSICSNPNREGLAAKHAARPIMDMFWRPTPENGFVSQTSPGGKESTTNGFFKFTESKRLDPTRKDAQWYSVVIDECRAGALDPDNYNFLHGYPTHCCGSWISKDDKLLCEDQNNMLPSDCRLAMTAAKILAREETSSTQDYTEKLASLLKEARTKKWTPWQVIQDAEKKCKMCRTCRTTRKRVLDSKATSFGREFALARLITPNNKPRYYASLQRAILFARFKRMQILWVQAEDFPIAGQIAQLSDNDLWTKRQQWLKRHDQDTGGIMGFFPLIPNLPVAFTLTLDKTRKIFKFTRGILRGWTLDRSDEEMVKHSAEHNIVLTKLPLMLYVEKEGDNMPQHMDLDLQIFGAAPRSVDWQIGRQSENWVKRFGFPLVPDFASTVHAATGDQLDTAIAELGGFAATPSQDDALKGYISLSRVKGPERILITEQFSPTLFAQGPLAIADLLLEVIENQGLPMEKLEQKLDAIEEQKKKRKNKLEDRTWSCGYCGKSKTYSAYVLTTPARLHEDINTHIVQAGAWRKCRRCVEDTKVGIHHSSSTQKDIPKNRSF